MRENPRCLARCIEQTNPSPGDAAVTEQLAPAVTGPLPWVLSAHDEAALRAHAAELRAYVEARPQLAPADVGWSLVAGREHLPRRAVVVGDDREALLAGLQAVA